MALWSWASAGACWATSTTPRTPSRRPSLPWPNTWARSGAPSRSGHGSTGSPCGRRSRPEAGRPEGGCANGRPRQPDPRQWNARMISFGGTCGQCWMRRWLRSRSAAGCRLCSATSKGGRSARPPRSWAAHAALSPRVWPWRARGSAPGWPAAGWLCRRVRWPVRCPARQRRCARPCRFWMQRPVPRRLRRATGWSQGSAPRWRLPWRKEGWQCSGSG